LTFNFGGGTIDMARLGIEKDICVVKATTEDTNLGEEDFDNRLVTRFLNEFRRHHRKDV